MHRPRGYVLQGALALLLCAVMRAGAQTAAAAPPAPAPPPAPFPAASGTPLAEQIAAITHDPAVVRAHWGVAVTAMDGTPIFGLNEGELFRPASNTKLFTTAAAMALLRTNDELDTTAAATALLSPRGVIKGDLVLTGKGEANLSDRPLPYLSPAERKRREEQAAPGAVAPKQPVISLLKIDTLARQIADKGVKRVTGDVVGDDSLWPWEPYANDWSIDDAVWGSGAPVSALTVSDNQLELTVAPGPAAGQPAVVTLKPDLGYYTVQASVTTVAAKQPASLRVERPIGSRVLQIFGTIAMEAPDTEEVAIEDPAEFAALALKKALEAHGVKVDGKARAKHRSPTDIAAFTAQVRTPVELKRSADTAVGACVGTCPVQVSVPPASLNEDVTVTLKVSQNLHAELLLRRLGKAYGTDGTAAQGARVVRQFLLNAGVNGDDFVFYDGSGLSGHDLVTPRATVRLLGYAATEPWFAPWKAALPVGGEDGTLASRFGKSALKDHLFAKTGTLSEARALSGYIECASGRTVIFSVMVDNHSPMTSADREAMDKIVEAIAAAE